MLTPESRAKEERLNADLSAVKKYFPVNLILCGIFKIVEDLYGNKCKFALKFQNFFLTIILVELFKRLSSFASAGLKFEKVNQALVWHHDVYLMSVLDTNTGEQIGYVYLDIYSR